MSGFLAAAQGAGTIADIVMTGERNRLAEGEARRNREFQADMSNTSHQREVKDLVAAGLNPNLSAGGTGATTPSGAMAPIEKPQIHMPDILGIAQLSLAKDQLDEQKRKTDLEYGVGGKETPKTKKQQAETDLTKIKTRKEGKGLIRADVEAKGAGYADKILTNLIKQIPKAKGPKAVRGFDPKTGTFNIDK